MKNVYGEYYERNKGYEINLYAYSPPPNGVFNFDGMRYDCGIDFRTVENYVTYRDCGFNTMLGQWSARYVGEPWETSEAKAVMDKVAQVGVGKFILLDDRLMKLSHETSSIIGEGKQFADEKELDGYVAECMKDYVKHPIFYGVQLVDEPYPAKLKALGQTYRAIKRVCPQAFVQSNLNPPVFIFANAMFPYDGDFSQRYKAYINEFLDETGADYFMADIYPFIANNEGSIGRMYIRGLQICAEIAAERGVEFKVVMQSMWYRINMADNWRKLERGDMFYQANALMGFGVKEFSYFTYWGKTDNNIKGEYFPDGQAIMKRNGEKTALYDYVQEVNALLQKLAPVMKDFEYLADAHNAKWPAYSRPMFLTTLSCKPLKNVVSFRPDKEVMLVSELYDKKNDRYLYRIMNGTDPHFGNEFGQQTAEIQFDKKFRYADVFTNGEWTTVELVDGKYVSKLMPGFADYVLLH